MAPAIRRPDIASALFSWLLVDWIAEPDAGSASVLIDELDAGSFKCSPDHGERGSAWLVRAALELAHGDDTDRGLVCEVLLTPIEKAPGGPALFRRDHRSSMHEMTDSINYVEKG
jgi:hypothetical protein